MKSGTILRKLFQKDELYITSHKYISRYRLVYNIETRRWLQIVLRYFGRSLMFFCPLPHIVKVPALVDRVEVWVRCGLFPVPPHLSEDRDVNGAHQLLANDVQAVCFKVLTYLSKSQLCWGKLVADLQTWNFRISSEFTNAPSPRA